MQQSQTPQLTTQSKHAQDLPKNQEGGVLIPILIIAILIVLFLIWQSGVLSGQSSQDETSQSPTTPAAQSLDSASPDNGTEETVQEELSERDMTPAGIASRKAKNFKPQLPSAGDSKALVSVDSAEEVTSRIASTEGIDVAAAELLARHTPDFASCHAEVDKQKALDCAAAIQTQALNQAFADHNELRARGDVVSLESGGEIMQRVIDGLQTTLQPFVEAAAR